MMPQTDDEREPNPIRALNRRGQPADAVIDRRRTTRATEAKENQDEPHTEPTTPYDKSDGETILAEIEICEIREWFCASVSLLPSVPSFHPCSRRSPCSSSSRLAAYCSGRGSGQKRLYVHGFVGILRFRVGGGLMASAADGYLVGFIHQATDGALAVRRADVQACLARVRGCWRSHLLAYLISYRLELYRRCRSCLFAPGTAAFCRLCRIFYCALPPLHRRRYRKAGCSEILRG